MIASMGMCNARNIFVNKTDDDDDDDKSDNGNDCVFLSQVFAFQRVCTAMETLNAI